MRKLDKPSESTDEFFRLCISKIRSVELSKRLAICENEVVNAAREYESKVAKAKLHTIIRKNNINGIITSKEMNDVYTYRMVPKKSPGRPLYDKILNSPAHGTCPLCGQRTVTTLDHHLPKSEYPALSVVPINLVPSCKDCNTIKLSGIPLSSDTETIHPYFDNIEDDKWLCAKVVKQNSVNLLFEVCPPDYWDPLLTRRVENHFKTFQLAQLYSAHAAVELNNIRFLLSNLFEQAGSEQVHALLETSAKSREEEHMNSWQSAMYRSLANSQWFYSQGIKYI